MRKLNKLLAGVSVAVLASFQAQATCVPADCNAMGYTKSASDCDGADMIKCPFNTNQVWCAAAGDPAANATPGMILYSDGTVSWDVISGKTPVGIVAYVEGATRFAVALEETTAKWGDYWGGDDYNVPCLTDTNDSQAQSDFNGASNTQCLVNDSQSHPAAEYCNSYKPVSSGTGSSGWYLPAVGELYVTSFSYEVINLGLHKLFKTQLSSDYYKSSNESVNPSSHAWVVRPSDGGMGDYLKDGKNLVRCVLAF